MALVFAGLRRFEIGAVVNGCASFRIGHSIKPPMVSAAFY
jgi:hypothetical protein